MAVDRRALWLGALLIAAVVAVMVVRSGDDPPQTARARPATARAPAPADTPAPPADVKLEALTAARDEPTETGRNPFRFQARPRGGPGPEVMRIPGVPDDQVDAPPVAAVPSGPPPPPPIALKFIGLVQKADGTRFAVLSDGKGPPISGREGEEIEGRYKILKIGTESLEIAYLDGRGRRTIPLTGQ
jgi:hypothetical protein